MTTFTQIKEAHRILTGIVKRTPLEKSKTFSAMTNTNVHLKLENLQNTGSFKLRGAYNKIYHLSGTEKKKGVVCSSAGNHAQGVAHAATLMQVKSTVFMPIHTPPTKIIATKSYGAHVVLGGETYDDAYIAAKQFADEKGRTFIHPFNDDLVIAGQGTLGIEIYEDLEDVDTVVVPVGGGGLIAGVALALKHLKPKVKIFGVEAEGAQSMKLSLEAQKIVPLTSISTIADGIAVKTPGDLTYQIVRKYVDKIFTVNDEEIAETLYLLLQRAKLVVEPAGAVALAAILREKAPMMEGNTVALISGGNINLPLLTQVIERSMMKNKLLTRISLIVPDRTWVLRDILTILGNLRVNVQGISHDRATTKASIGYVNIIITFQTLGTEQIEEIKRELKRKNIRFEVVG